MPFPGNFGFIPSTDLRINNLSTSKPLEAIVLAEQAPVGTIYETTPLATLLVETAGELKYIVVAVPSRPSEQIISATDLASFSANYPAAKEIIQRWFIAAFKHKSYKFIGWKDERFTEQLIQKYLK